MSDDMIQESMKAAVLHSIGELPQIEDLPKPAPVAGEALVRVRAAALNRRDVWIMQGLYPGIRWPVVPGSDGAGEVVAVGSAEDEGWLGRLAILNPNRNWGASERAQAADYHILGMPTQGTLAQYVCVPVDRLHPLPAHLEVESAAALPLAGLTAWRALFARGGLQSGQHVLVTGAGGGVALFAIQFAVAAGASVWTTSGSTDKIANAVKLGAVGGAVYKEDGWAKALLAESGGFDLIVDGAAGAGFPKLIELAKPGGTIVLYGGTAGDFPAFNPGRLFWKQVNVLGSTMGSDADFSSMLAFVQEKRVEPVLDQICDFNDAAQAFIRMSRGDQIGKIVLQVAR